MNHRRCSRTWTLISFRSSNTFYIQLDSKKKKVNDDGQCESSKKILPLNYLHNFLSSELLIKLSPSVSMVLNK
jgi:hypothetical protein